MDSLLEMARRIGRAVIRSASRRIAEAGPYCKNYKLYFKGSAKDPFLYLEASALILFVIIAFAAPSSSDNSDSSFGASPQTIENKDSFVSASTKVQESPQLSFIQKNSLAAVSPPIVVTPQVLGALSEATDYEWNQKEVVEYVVQPGDTLGLIAGRFNISLDTLLWANDLAKNSSLRIGQNLTILPVSGVIHHVKRGDNLSQIAQTYKANPDEVIVFNDLSTDGDIYIGDVLIIPGGKMPPPVRYAPPSVPLASSYFICPISQPCRMTQGLHWYNAIDFSNGKCGDPIFATAAGEVLRVRLTNSRSQSAFGGAGNNLSILHPNGVVTSYGHIQTSLVNAGDTVYQGQIIATIGGMPGTPGAGKSTGCHVHFGVQNARNPFAK